MLVKEYYKKNNSDLTLFNISDYVNKDNENDIPYTAEEMNNFYFSSEFVGVVIDNQGTVAYFKD